MTNFIPIFPLNIVVYPGEKLNLHIFEARYIEMVRECISKNKNFGIPSVINNEVKELGTAVKILSVEKEYKNGSIDIKTEGVEVFRILEVIKTIEGKKYSGAIVNYPANNLDGGSTALMNKILPAMRAVYKQLKVDKDFNKNDEDLKVYDIAHLVGMTVEEEYILLELNNELHRQEYLRRHLNKLLPLVDALENLRHKIKMNGHFRNLEGFKFGE